MHLKSLAGPFFLSVGLHAATVASFQMLEDRKSSFPSSDSILVEVVHVELEPSAKSAVIPSAPTVKKMGKNQIKGLPTVFSQAKAQSAPQRPAVKAATPTLSARASTPLLESKNGAELMTDPQRGKIFINYFGNLKTKIHQTVLKEYSPTIHGTGEVALFFVLNAQGRLEEAKVLDRESRAGTFLKQMALDFLKASAPFGAFPSELGAKHLSFSVTVYFEENA